MEQKLIVFDIDGTILSYKEKTHIPEATKEAIFRLRENGHLLAFATGRSFALTQGVMRELSIFSAVLHNGALSMHDGSTISEKRMSKGTTKSLLERILHTNLCVFADDGQYLYTQNASDESLHFMRELLGDNDILMPLELCKRELFTMNIYSEKSGGTQAFEKVVGAEWHESEHEFRTVGISKNYGVARLAEFFCLDLRNVIAVGDGKNDIGMIKSAGVGIAVGGACDVLKNAADFVTDDIDEGGIKTAFERLGLI
jgi:Cof subfamily protein (haloacid dehalogenase superfamily)